MPTELLEPRAPAAPPTAEPRPSRDPVLRVLDRILETPAEVYLTACRLILGVVMLAHATQKVFGWFGGAGFSATLQSFSAHLGIPLVIGFLVVLVELFGSLGLILGFLGRMASVCIMAVMVGAILLVHLDNGFFMNWTGKGHGEGYEYHLLAIGLTLPILAKGSGAYSVDGWVVRILRGERVTSR